MSSPITDHVCCGCHQAQDTRQVAVLNGVEMIATERQRQIDEEGWTPEHDNEHTDRSLSDAAAAYAMGGGELQGLLDDRVVNLWPSSWGAEEDTIKSKPRLRQLVIAGALIAAEIDRLLRAAATPSSGEAPQSPRVCVKCGHNNLDREGNCNRGIVHPKHLYGKYPTRFCGCKCVFPEP